MAVTAHNPPRSEEEAILLKIAVGQQHEINDLHDRISELEEHAAKAQNADE